MKIVKTSALLLLMWLACVWAVPAMATSVVSVPAPLFVPPGGDAVVPISVSPADGVISLDATVTYDPAVVTPTLVTTTAYTSGFELQYNVPSAGTLAISMFSANPLSGSGEVAWIVFHAVGSNGTNTAITLTQHDLNENNIPSTAGNGTLNVATAQSTISTPDNSQGAPTFSVHIPIYANPANGIIALDLDVFWNQNIISATSVVAGDVPGDWEVNANISTPGRAQISAFGVTPLTGNRRIADIVVTVVGTFGQQTPIDIRTADANEGTITTALDDGLFTVVCDDQNDCTDDSFNGSSCVFTNRASGSACGDPSSSSCDDADTCNGSGVCQQNHHTNGSNCGTPGTCENQDTCFNGLCQDNGFQNAGTPCNSPSNTDCDNPDTCNGSGVCLNNNEPNGTFCGDSGTQCTNQDTCVGGLCQDNGYQPNTTPCGSPADTNCDNPDTCDGTGGCAPHYEPNGFPCSDGLGCTTSDACNGTGTCLGTPVVCNDSNQCTTDTCVEPSGSCDYGTASGVCDISGNIYYYRDSVGSSEPSTKPVPGETVRRDRAGHPFTTDITDAAGQYDFPDEAGDITLTPQNLLAVDDASCHAAITAADATSIARFTVLLINLTNNQRVAGDVSNNGTVSAFDASLVATRAVAPNCASYAFPIRTQTGSDWAWRPVSRSFTPLTGIAEDYGFLGIFYGDVTGNWTAPVLFAAESPAIPDTDVRSEAPVLDLDDTTSFGAAIRPAGSSLAKLDAADPTERINKGRFNGAVLYLASGPRQNPNGSYTVELAIQRADGIQGLDLSLHYDRSAINVTSVTTIGIASNMTAVTNNAGNDTMIAAFGTTPLAGSGSFLRVTYSMLNHVDGVPFTVGAQANEGQIPLVWSPGLPPGGAPRQSIKVTE
jgi:hypothetical protein